MFLFSKKFKVFFLGLLCVVIQQSLSAVVILLNGTSSAGKSSIARELKNMLVSTGSSAEIVGLDSTRLDVLKNMAAEKGIETSSSACLSDLFDEHVFTGTIPGEEFLVRSKEAMFQRVHSLALAHKHVILDTVAHKKDELDECLTKLSDLPIVHVLVYSSPKALFEHVTTRNQGGVRDERRSFYNVLRQFATMYELLQDSQSGADTLDTERTKIEIHTALESVRSELNAEQSAGVQQLLETISQKFKLHEPGMVTIRPFFSYDLLVNTGAASSEECAQQIVDHLNKN